MTEADFQKQVIDIAHAFRWRVAHFRKARTNKGWRTPVGADGKGFPDLVLVRDRVIFAELKQDGRYPNDDQRDWLAALNAANAETYVWRPKDFDQIKEVLR